jgi:sRNA-binding regulator protein Hfq
MANHPEIKIYPVEYHPAPKTGYDMGSHAAQENYSWQESNRRRSDVDRYLRGLVGKPVRVHTSNAGQLRGVVEAILSEAILIRTERGQVLIHDWAIEAIESE